MWRCCKLDGSCLRWFGWFRAEEVVGRRIWLFGFRVRGLVGHQLKETTGGEFRVYRASIRLL